jgi:DNA-binding cell septation regulator SpoVG
MIILPLRREILIITGICFLIFATAIFADMKITEIEKKTETYDIVLNNDIKVLNISLKNNHLEFPKYKGEYKIYQQFSILKRDFRNYLLDALVQGKMSSDKYITSFKVNKMSVLKVDKPTKAFASVIFCDDIEVECRIVSGRSGLWVVWPSNLNNGTWIKNFMFINKKLQKEVEKKLIEQYTYFVQVER